MPPVATPPAGTVLPPPRPPGVALAIGERPGFACREQRDGATHRLLAAPDRRAYRPDEHLEHHLGVALAWEGVLGQAVDEVVVEHDQQESGPQNLLYAVANVVNASRRSHAIYRAS